MAKNNLKTAAAALGRLGGKAAQKRIADRTEYARALNRARWGEPERCPCGCGMTLGRARKRHPARLRDFRKETK